MRSISISTCFDYAIPIHEQLPLIKKAGFTHASIGGNYEHSGILMTNGPRRLSDLVRSQGLTIDTLHGVVLDKQDALETMERLADAANQLDAPIIVIHCSSFTFDPHQYEDRYSDVNNKIEILEQIAKNQGIKFALENVLPGIATDLMRNILLASPYDCFGFCYDSSHDQVDGPKPFTLLEQLKDQLIAVHISDRIKEFTDHVIPGEGFVDFNSMSRIIQSSPYRAPLLMEVMTTYSKYKQPDEFLRAAYEKACNIYDMIFSA